MASIERILQAMTIYGGAFVQQLAVLYRLGDMINRRKLEVTFADYFREYDALASKQEDGWIS